MSHHLKATITYDNSSITSSNSHDSAVPPSACSVESTTSASSSSSGSSSDSDSSVKTNITIPDDPSVKTSENGLSPTESLEANPESTNPKNENSGDRPEKEALPEGFVRPDKKMQEFYDRSKTNTEQEVPSEEEIANSGTPSPPQVEPTTKMMLSDGKRKEDNQIFDREDPQNGKMFLSMFLKEQWKAQADTCRIDTDITLQTLIDIGKQECSIGCRRCRNIIHCPGIEDAIALSLWELLSGSVPTPEDLLYFDDTCSVLSLQFVERFMIPKQRSQTAPLSDCQSVISLQFEERVMMAQWNTDRPVISGRRASWNPVSEGSDGFSFSSRSEFSMTTTEHSFKPSLTRSRSSASLWAKRQRGKINNAGEAIGRGYGNTYDDATMRIFLLKAMGLLKFSLEDGRRAMEEYQDRPKQRWGAVTWTA